MITQAQGITKKGPRSRQERPAARKLVFMGGKGGVGTTQIAANMAVELGLKGNRVLFVDAGVGDARLILGIDCKLDLRNVISGEKSIEEIVCPGPGGISVLPAHCNREQAESLAPWQRERLLRGLSATATVYDFVLADTVRGVSPGLPAWGPTEVIVLTTPEATSLAGTYARIKELARLDPGGMVHTVVNMACDGPQATRTFKAIDRVAERFLGRVPSHLGWVPADNSVRRAGGRRVPFVTEYPDQPTAAAVEAMASKLALGGPAPGNLGFIGNESCRD